ncbi:MAG TPA: hypothetical protein VNW52_12960 [Burkholderiaceae bacterium]|jgi:hypothetical protein|nr:hypothetical protein [Burkholderiaceae bacterium]
MGMSIDEMKLVDRARAQLDQLMLQVANRDASMKKNAADTALVDFKTYFSNREFSLTGSDWNVSATHGSIVFALAIKNAPTGGPECLILKFPEMLRRAPLTVYLEAQVAKPVANSSAVAEPAKSVMQEIEDRMTQMRDRLAAPPVRWMYYTKPDAPTPERKDYMSFTRLLDVECP